MSSKYAIFPLDENGDDPGLRIRLPVLTSTSVDNLPMISIERRDPKFGRYGLVVGLYRSSISVEKFSSTSILVFVKSYDPQSDRVTNFQEIVLPSKCSAKDFKLALRTHGIIRCEGAKATTALNYGGFKERGRDLIQIWPASRLTGRIEHGDTLVVELARTSGIGSGCSAPVANFYYQAFRKGRPEGPSDIREGFYDVSAFRDVMFYFPVSGRTIFSVSAELCQASQYFKDLLNGGFSESQPIALTEKLTSILQKRVESCGLESSQRAQALVRVHDLPRVDLKVAVVTAHPYEEYSTVIQYFHVSPHNDRLAAALWEKHSSPSEFRSIHEIASEVGLENVSKEALRCYRLSLDSESAIEELFDTDACLRDELRDACIYVSSFDTKIKESRTFKVIAAKAKRDELSKEQMKALLDFFAKY